MKGSREVDRRTLLLGSMIAAAALGHSPAADAVPVADGTARVMLGRRPLHIVDVTHALTAAWNWSPTSPRVAMDPIVGSGYSAGMALNRLMLVEHTGTHVDVPRHFDPKGKSLGEIPIGDLVVPLALIDLRQRAMADDDVGLMPADILAWEKAHGRLPDGCCVAINSGFDPFTGVKDLLAGKRKGMPGISPEAAAFLMNARKVKGLAVDTMSLDQGSKGVSYPVHQQWLRSGRWGIEGLTNLDAVPTSGAILFVGAAPVADTTGIPIRGMAMFEGK